MSEIAFKHSPVEDRGFDISTRLKKIVQEIDQCGCLSNFRPVVIRGRLGLLDGRKNIKDFRMMKPDQTNDRSS